MSSPSSQLSFGALVILCVALAAAVFGAVYTALMTRTVREKQTEVYEMTRPARLAIIRIAAPSCTACFSLGTAIETLKKERIEITEDKTVTADSEEGKKLILDHNIRKIPTYIATGEVSKEKFGAFMDANGEQHGDAFILTNLPPAFVELALNKERGSVDAILITDPQRCSDCTDPLFLTDRLKQGAGVALRDEKVLRSDAQEARALIAKYAIRKLPAMILTGDVAFYSLFQNTALGTIEKDGAFVLRDVPLPYFDLLKGRVVRGDVTLIMITDATCVECYDVTNHKQILARFGVKVVSEKTVDIASSEGKQLRQAYRITKVPTILLSPEASAYEQLTNVWNQVGTIAKSGWYVFNKFEELGPVVYKDLALNKIIRPVTPPTDK